MWFFFGFFSVFAAVAFFTKHRLAANWTGTHHNTSRCTYELGIDRHKGNITRIRVGIPCITGFYFKVRRETLTDKLFKSLGLSVEQQFQNLAFDENIYVLSDDCRLSEAIKNKLSVQGHILAIFDRNLLPGFTAKEIWCQRNRLWITAEPKYQANTETCTSFAAQAAPMLGEISGTLQTGAPANTGTKDRFIFKAALLLGISTALAVNVCIQAFRLIVLHFPVVLDNNALLHQALLPSLVMAALLIFVCILLLGRTSRAHVVLLELIFIGVAGAYGTAYFELRDYNIDFDASPPRKVATTIIDKHTTRCGKRNRSTCYHIELAGWPGYAQGIRLQVNRSLYDTLTEGGTAEIKVHDGELGSRWIEEPTPRTW